MAKVKRVAPPIVRYMAQNNDAITMVVAGFDDYIASRACVRFNCFFQGAVLGAQAVEKLFKGGLRLSGDQTPFKQRGHNIVKVAQNLDSHGWFSSGPFRELIEVLNYHFAKSRYPRTQEDGDYRECLRGISQEHFDGLDELVLSFMDSLPVPTEVKYGLGVYAKIHNREMVAELGIPFVQWGALAWRNKALGARLPAMLDARRPFVALLTEYPIQGLYKTCKRIE